VTILTEKQNGVVIMVLYHSRQTDGDNESPLTKGKIQLQPEGAEVFINILIQPIHHLPDTLIE